MKQVWLNLNAEILRVSGALTLIIFAAETLQPGFVRFYFNLVWILAVFLLSGAVWLFTPDKVEK